MDCLPALLVVPLVAPLAQRAQTALVVAVDFADSERASALVDSAAAMAQARWL
jgi:hypothetical protein